MPGISLAETIGQLGRDDEWGPEVVDTTTLDGVPYAPYSKGDKLGRMADWTQEGKEGRDRQNRQYGRNFRGMIISNPLLIKPVTNPSSKISRSTEPALRPCSPYRWVRTNHPSRLSTIPGQTPRPVDSGVAEARFSAVVGNVGPHNEVNEEGFKELDNKEEHLASNKISTTTIVVAGVAEVGGLVGATTTSHNATETTQSIFVLNGP